MWACPAAAAAAQQPQARQLAARARVQRPTEASRSASNEVHLAAVHEVCYVLVPDVQDVAWGWEGERFAGGVRPLQADANSRRALRGPEAARAETADERPRRARRRTQGPRRRQSPRMRGAPLAPHAPALTSAVSPFSPSGICGQQAAASGVCGQHAAQGRRFAMQTTRSRLCWGRAPAQKGVLSATDAQRMRRAHAFGAPTCPQSRSTLQNTNTSVSGSSTSA